jgi:hypothetical protein
MGFNVFWIRHQLVSPRVMIAHKHTIQKNNAKVIIAMTDALSSTGISEKNPHNFKHFFLEECYLRIDTPEKPYLNRIKLNFEQNMYLDRYMTLFDALNNHNVGNIISRTDWPNGFPVFAFNLQTISGDYLSNKKKSLITVDLKFAQKSIEAHGKADIS